MKPISIAALVAALIAATPSAHAEGHGILGISEAGIELFDLDPNDGVDPVLAWTGGQFAEAFARQFESSGVLNSVLGWDNTASASEGPAASVAEPLGLTAVLATLQPGDTALARALHYGYFHLSAQTMVRFSAPAHLLVSPAQAASIQARATMITSVDGSTATTEDMQSLVAFYHQFDVLPIADGLLSVTYTNATGITRAGAFHAIVEVDAIAPLPVPEPETYAMLLAGLGLLALRRRTATAPRN